MRNLFLLLLLGAGLGLGGCATRPETAIGTAESAKVALVGSLTEDDRMSTRLSVPTPADGVLDVLVLSGGGSNGAFGAGLMNGWTESGKRPNFDIVTGVSTGALIATLAFLGPDYDERLKKVFTESTDKDILKERGVLGLAKGSLYSRAPLEAQIAREVTDETLKRVAAEHAKGRRLYVATVDIDSGILVVWNLGRLAASSDPNKLSLYRAVLAASAAIPGAFPPVYLPGPDGNPVANVDGGVKQPFLFRPWMIESGARQTRVWAVTAGGLHLRNEKGPVGPNSYNIIGRSIGEMLRTLTFQSLYRIYATSRNRGAEFRLAYLPDDVPETDPIRFDPADMNRLFEFGRQFAKSGTGWKAEPPFLTGAERFR